VDNLPSIPENWMFHHVGYATRNIDREYNVFSLLGYQMDGETFCDPTQGVVGCFLTGPGPRMELLEPMPGSETLTPFLSAGIKMYHLGYQVKNIELALDWVKSNKGKVIVNPVPAIAFGCHRISFVMFRNGLLIELIEG
jgi:methylmalonyl-CoA/ethylmalonyl-CoA epimerase